MTKTRKKKKYACAQPLPNEYDMLESVHGKEWRISPKEHLHWKNRKGAETSSTVFINTIKYKANSAQNVLFYICCTLRPLSYRFCFWIIFRRAKIIPSKNNIAPFLYNIVTPNGLSLDVFNNVKKYSFRSLTVVENKYQHLHFIHSLHTSGICDISISALWKYPCD